ncbi:uncharacterized protein LOC124385191 [Silurus meridionalis]|uniref:uncharacterized protein LOC124385191 n=1 Tax=Silurus meridionalis TaxID=175797 RepID=UPI001EEA08F8|nr:uncharacterized protein LOC124385191 [Silurus meridionalis]
MCSLQLEMEEMAAQSPHQQRTNEDAGLWDFLRKRGVPEQNIDQMQQDRIDTSVVRELDDTCLARYIPLYGDRIATRRYCLDKQKRKDDSCSKMSLLEKLRKKMSTATTSHEEETTEERRPTKKASYKRNATKSSRKIELGWLHEGKQVRKRCGGGTRILDISKDATKNDLMSHAKELFFPHEVIVGGIEDASSASQLDDTVPVVASTEEVINVGLSTSTPVKHTVCSSGNADYELLSETHLIEPFQDFSPTEEVISVVPSTSTLFVEDGIARSNFGTNYELLTVGIKLHRVNLLEEMICQFKDELILNYPLKYSFINEKGHDADGVSRDVYAAFWTEFLDCAAEGAEMRVPSLSPKWQEDEWKAVGRILAKGFLDQGYFPLRVAPAFTTALIFGEHAVSTDLLYQSLLLYLSQCERDLITTALQQDLDSDGQDELLDLLDRLGVKTVPSQDNLKAVLIQVAHKQIIQQPKYALDNMSVVAAQPLMTTLTTPAKIWTMYDDKKPTPRKVLKLIEANPTTPAENQAFKFQYIRGLDQVGLRRMLRFVTGSDVICVTEIRVVFTTLDGLARRPVAHTCGSVLELPCTYNSYPELRVEMENVLTSSYYTMDIV